MSENDKKQDSHPAEDSKDFKIPHSRDRYLYSIVRSRDILNSKTPSEKQASPSTPQKPENKEADE